MAPVVPDQNNTNSNNNWLTFSLYPTMDMMGGSSVNESDHHQQQQHQNSNGQAHQYMPYEVTAAGVASAEASSPQYYLDNFYANGYQQYSKPQIEYLNQHHQSVVPKLENFLDSSSMVRYTDSQTDTQDSTLTHIYEHGPGYYNNQEQQQQQAEQLNKAIAGFQSNAFSSGSDVEDSSSLNRNQLVEFESGNGQNNLIAFAQQPGQSGVLSLGVNNNKNISSNNKSSGSEEKSIVPVVDSSKKISDTFGQRTSIYRGVTRHRWTGRYEAHLWDNSCRREGQARKGRQVYLGGYDKEDKAARAYDLAALKYWGPTATTNFPLATYAKELEEMKPMTKQEFIASLRRKSSGFSRGASIYRGVTRHHQQGRWQARIGRVAGNKDLYLGTFATEEEAAEAYDIAAIKFRGINAVTNFEMNRYDVEAITNSTLPVGGAAKRLKSSLEAEKKAMVSVALSEPRLHNSTSSSGNISFSLNQPMSSIPCGIPFDAMPLLYQQNFYHQLQSNHVAAIALSESQNSASSNIATANGDPINFLPTQPEYYMWPHQSY